MPLPVMTVPDDALRIVGFMKRSPGGVSIDSVKATVGEKLVDGRKVAAYVAWGFIEKAGDELQLTEFGRALARADAEEHSKFFARVILGCDPYRLAVDRAHYQSIEEITAADMAAHWMAHAADHVGRGTGESVRRQAVCFFGLAQAAGLGTMFLGRRGKETRLTFDLAAIAALVEQTADDSGNSRAESTTAGAGAGAGRQVAGDHAAASAAAADGGADTDESGPAQAEGPLATPPSSLAETSEGSVFISHGKNTRVLDQVKTMLDLAGMDYEVAIEQETLAKPVPYKVLESMRACSAAVICVTADDGVPDGSTHRVNQNVLIEIGAAFVLYDPLVVLVWDKRVEVPSNLQGLYRCEYEGEELSWESGTKLMAALVALRDAEDPDRDAAEGATG